MRIHHLSAATIPSRTANSLQAMKMTEALAALGHDVTLFCLTGPAPESAPDPFAYYGVRRRFDIVRCDWPAVRGVGSYVYARRVARAVQSRGSPDLLYGRHFPSLALAGSPGTPTVAEAHLPPAHPLQRFVMHRVLGRDGFRKLLVISEALREECRRLFPDLPGDRIVVAPSAAEVPDADTRPVDVGGRPAAPRVGYAGHLYPGKGVEIIQSLAAVMPQVDFHVIGGTEGDLAQWRGRGLPPNVLFHGHVPPGELSGWLQAFPIVVAPYLRRVGVSGGGDAGRWMSPLKIFDYMAHGRAVVASDLPVLRGIVEDGVTGLLCAPEDLAGWQAAVQRLIEAPEDAAAIGRRAREVAGRHTWLARAQVVVS